jgi:putative ABC transport system substrate-binding protein
MKQQLDLRRAAAAHLKAALVLLMVVFTGHARADTARIPRIGWIAIGSAEAYRSSYGEFQQGLQDLGYVEGRTILLEPRFADGVPSQVPGLIKELLARNVDIVVAMGPTAYDIRQLTRTLPVVYAVSGDVIEAGLAESLARPGGNLTGLSFMAVDMNTKRLQLLKEALPHVTRVTLLANPAHPGEHLEVEESRKAAQALGITLQYLEVRSAAEFDAAFEAMHRGNSEAIVAVPDSLLLLERERLAEYADRNRLPVISGWAEFARSGSLMTYGPNTSKEARRLAPYVDKILKGEKPGNLPVQQPTRFELVVNLKAASQLGITMPPTILLRADEVIE